MQSLKRGWIFTRQLLTMTRTERGVLRPSGSAGLAGLALILASLILNGLCLGFGWRSAAGWAASGFLICLCAIGQVAIGTIFAPLTAVRVSTHLAETVCTVNFRDLLRRAWLDLTIFSIARPGLWIASQIRAPRAKPARKTDSSAIDPLESPSRKAQELGWINASYLVVPIMGIEGLNLRDSLVRVEEFINGHMLRLSAGMIGVHSLSWLVSALLTLIGILAGWAVYHFAIPLGQAIPLRSALITCLAIFILDLFILAAVLVASYLNSAYATCLYLWSCGVEKARLENRDEPAGVPALLSAALAK